MDWQRLTADVARVDQYTGRDLEAALQALSDEPHARAIRSSYRRTAALDGFLQTSSPFKDATAPAELSPDDHIDIWRIEEAIGVGGMGEVYRVSRDDGQFVQQAALKLMRSRDTAAPARFTQERERLAALEHHGISRIIDGGETSDGRPYMVVEFVDGEPIDRYVRSARLREESIIRLLIELSAALAHAHARLVLHRDVKPSNVLVDDTGRIRLIDFGVAALLDTDHGHAGPLTIGYAAPETLGEARLTVAADIFSVGIVAYELFTGRLPARTPNGAAVIARERLENADLRSIVAKATAESPAARYLSIEAFADDLIAYLAQRPVSARAGGRVYVLGKLLRRHPTGTALTVGLMVSLAAGLGGTSVMASRARQEAARATAALAQAEHALEKAEQNARIQDTYGDVLHRSFAGEGNTERMTELLLDRWRQAFALRDQDPKRAAEISFAVGRNFVERNDYRTAVTVLGPWIEAGFGDARLLTDGKLNLGIAHHNLGNTETATTLLMEAEQAYANSFDEGTFQHLVAQAQLAYVTMDPRRIESLETRLHDAVKGGGAVEEVAFYWNTLENLQIRRGDFEAAERSCLEASRLLDAHPLAEITGRDVILVNKIMYGTFVSQDFVRVRADIERLMSVEAKKGGDTIAMAYGHELLSMVRLFEGTPEGAVSEARRARELAEALAGRRSILYVNRTATYIEALAAAGHVDRAANVLEELERLLVDFPGGRYHPFILAKAYILAKTVGAEQASSWLKEMELTEAKTNRNVQANFRMSRLKSLGVVPALTGRDL